MSDFQWSGQYLPSSYNFEAQAQEPADTTRDRYMADTPVNSVNNANKAGENAERVEPRPNGSLIVSEEDNRRIRRQLDRMIMEAGATSTLLLDKSGEVISARGDQLPRDLDVMGALLAGTFATS